MIKQRKIRKEQLEKKLSEQLSKDIQKISETSKQQDEESKFQIKDIIQNPSSP
jgi:hypothetical protein